MLAIGVIVMGLGLAGCAGSTATVQPSVESARTAEPTSIATPEPTPTPTATPQPTPDLEALGDQYLAIVNASNAVACGLNDALQNSPSDLPLLQDRATELAAAERAAADALRAMAFPPDLQTLIDQQVAGLAALEAALLAFAAAGDWAAANVALQRVVDASATGSEGSNLIRGELGLPSIVADPCGN